MPGHIKRSVTIDGHKTSISLEQPFWDALKDIAGKNHISLNALITKIDKERSSGGLSSAIRVYILYQYREIKPE